MNITTARSKPSPRPFSRVKSSLGAVVTLSLLAACQLSPATTPPPTSTEAPAPATPVPPTETPVVPASVTPAPSPTSTPEPTATASPTPNATATPDPNLGVGATIYEDKFDGARWGWNFSDDVVTFALADGQLNAVMKRSDSGWRIDNGPDFVTAGDQQTRLTARTNLCYDNDEYGLMFRTITKTDSNNTRFDGYLFKLNCAGQARVEVFKDSQISVLMDWTASPAIQKGAPAENTLMVWAAKDQFHVYVNDKHVGSLTDPSFAEGVFGVYLRDRTNGGLSVSFSNLVVKEVKLAQ
jgi:hypothetical protein